MNAVKLLDLIDSGVELVFFDTMGEQNNRDLAYARRRFFLNNRFDANG